MSTAFSEKMIAEGRDAFADWNGKDVNDLVRNLYNRVHKMRGVENEQFMRDLHS